MKADLRTQQFILESQHGSHEAFAELYRQFADKIFRYIRLKVPDKQQAEDLLQEVFIKAWKALPQFDVKSGYFSAWLYRIAGNSITDFYRKKMRMPQTFELNDESLVQQASQFAEAGPLHVLPDTERLDGEFSMAQVASALAALPEHYRTVLELRYIQDFTLRESAEIMGRTYLAVRLLEHRALKKLRSHLHAKHA